MNRIKRFSGELLQKHAEKFGLEFDANKKAVNDLAIVRSKVLRNEIAGYITSHLRKQAAQEKASMAVGTEEESEGPQEQDNEE